MANSIETTTQIAYKNAAGAIQLSIPAKKITQSQASNIYVSGVQNIGTSAEIIDLGSVATDGGSAFFRNLDATNFVEVGLDVSATFVPFLKIPPGEQCYLTGLSDKDVYARANTAAVDLEYYIWAP